MQHVGRARIVAIGLALTGLLAQAVAASGTAPAAPVPVAPSVEVTVGIAGGESCSYDLGCRVRFRVNAAGSTTPVLKAKLDPDVVGAHRQVTLSPGAYEVRVTALGVSDAHGTTVPVGSCGAALGLVAAHPVVTMSAAMNWSQPACGIVIDPRVPGGLPRPDLSTRIVPNGPPPRYQPSGPPTVATTDHGVRLQLWIKDASLLRGQWLVAHARIKNVSDEPITYAGRFKHLDCPPVSVDVDTSDLFDPGNTWSGMAGDFKRRWLATGILQRAGLGIPARDRGDGCGDVGYVSTLKRGQVVDIPLAGLPAYQLKQQPLPPGTMHVTVTIYGKSYRKSLASVSTDVTLGGTAVGYPSPGQLVDAALATPGFLEVLAQASPPNTWANAMLATWFKHPYPAQPRLAGAMDAPDGIVELGWFLDSSPGPFVVGAVIDPWTADSYSAYGW